MTPRKVRLVANAIRQLSPNEALDYLKFINKRAAKALSKVIKQAIANAENNHKLNKKNLSFNKLDIQEGATYKRWRPVSRGRAHSIFKRTCHIEVVLEGKEEEQDRVKKATRTGTITKKVEVERKTKTGREKKDIKKPKQKKENTKKLKFSLKRKNKEK